MSDIAVIVLAAGLGTRMKSAIPKVLHKAAGRTLLGHVLAAAAAVRPAQTIVVTGSEMPHLEEEARQLIPNAQTALQQERKGTGHAVLSAREALVGFSGTIVVLYGDVPLIRPETVQKLAASVSSSTPMTVLAFHAANPTGYGRVICDKGGFVTAIREELDATPEQRRLDLCNSGLLAIDASQLWRLLPKVGNGNAKGEYYLTDLVELVAASNSHVGLIVCPESEVMGVNTRAQLAEVEAHFQARYRDAAMAGGATLIDPSSVFFSADTKIGQDVIIEPNVFFGLGVTIEDNVTIMGFTHIDHGTIAKGARVGPFARLRPGAEIGEDVHIGNFVEVKKSKIEKGAKANHLSYIGDARVGPKSNIGAGTITCNYDGFGKYQTDIGANVFIGTNTALVAPVKIGDGAYIAAGSVITKEVPGDAMAIARSEQAVKLGWAARYRELKSARKKAKG
jgi:bifunctional UDP-N-acetylglucosamine pyrophosphorylase/glucosamine-1-phosphate N-acetyltransferase